MKPPKLKPCGVTRLSIIHCHAHDYWGIDIGDLQTGHRITPSKCCGSWTTFKSWQLSSDEWADLAERALVESRRAGGRRKK